MKPSGKREKGKFLHLTRPVDNLRDIINTIIKCLVSYVLRYAHFQYFNCILSERQNFKFAFLIVFS